MGDRFTVDPLPPSNQALAHAHTHAHPLLVHAHSGLGCCLLASLLRKETLLPQDSSPSPCEQRTRKPNDDRQRCQNATAHPEAQRREHPGREQRDDEAKRPPEDGRGAEGAGGVHRVRVDEVLVHAVERPVGADGEEDRPDVGHDDVELLLGAPAIPQQPDHGEGRGREQQRDAELGLGFLVRRAGREVLVDDVADRGVDLR